MSSFFDIRGRAQILSNANMEFQAHEIDETSTPYYYGFVSHIGSWVIMRHNEPTGQIRYAAGKQFFSTNWDSRASLDYKYINEFQS